MLLDIRLDLLRTIGQVVITYRDQLMNFVYETLNGNMDATSMRRAHNALVRTLGPQAYYEGLREGGVPLKEAPACLCAVTEATPRQNGRMKNKNAQSVIWPQYDYYSMN